MKRKIEKRRNEIAVEIARQYADLLAAKKDGLENAVKTVEATLAPLVANFNMLEELLDDATDEAE